jgi:hypothetical protein
VPDKWDKYAVKADAGADKWAKYAVTPETPDPTKPAPGTKPDIKMETSPFGGAHPSQEQQAKIDKLTPQVPGVVSEVRKGALELGGGAIGGAGANALVKGGGGLLAVLARMFGTGVGAGAGNYAVSRDPKEAVKTGAAFAATEGAGEGVAKVLNKAFPRIDPLRKINKLLGVSPEEVRPGKVPASLDQFASNPARGAMKVGLDEKKLAAMNPLERNIAISKARDAAGQELDQILKAATASGKKVDIMPGVTKTFQGILDPKLGKMAQTRLMQILQKSGINKPLTQLTPSEAREIQKGLDSFANFSSEGEAKSFKDIATQLRRGISEATHKVVPESVEADQLYSDLAGANNATQGEASKYAVSVPENKLRKWIIRGIATGAGLGTAGALGYEGARHYSSTPVP